jgi:hypothetical protein
MGAPYIYDISRLRVNKQHFPHDIYGNISVKEVDGGTAWSVQRFAEGWTVSGLNSGGGEIFRTRKDRPWGPLNLPYLRIASLPLG